MIKFRIKNSGDIELPNSYAYVTILEDTTTSM